MARPQDVLPPLSVRLRQAIDDTGNSDRSIYRKVAAARGISDEAAKSALYRWLRGDVRTMDDNYQRIFERLLDKPRGYFAKARLASVDARVAELEGRLIANEEATRRLLVKLGELADQIAAQTSHPAPRRHGGGRNH